MLIKNKKNILDYLEESAIKYPNKIAFADDKNEITYSVLVKKAKEVASKLAEYSLTNKPIAIINEKSVETIIMFMAIVYSGNFYVVINPDFPIERKNKVLNTLDYPLLIIAKKYINDKFNELKTKEHLILEEVLESNYINEKELNKIRTRHLDLNPLYAMFTSGSTGEPKGIVVNHQSVIDFTDEFVDTFMFNSKDVIGNQAPFDFDVSVKDIYTTIKVGATMQIIPKGKFSFPTLLIDYLCDKEITTLIWAVSALTIIPILNGFSYKVPEKINRIMFSGEVMPVKHLNEWKKYLPNADYINLYGPTEITCNCTYYVIENGFYNKEYIPIGKPFSNEKVFLLDDKDKLVTSKNTQGEICVSGSALSIGYYNNENETNKVFVQNPLNKFYYERIYRTGDLGYYGDDNNLYFSARKDFQIKHMGHRIELSEIENSFLKISEIKSILVSYDKENKELIAFYQGDILPKEIIEILKESLPRYMVPNKFKKLDLMPLTNNGKINRKLLMEEYKNE